MLSRAFLLPHLENFSQRRRPPLLKPQMMLSRAFLLPHLEHFSQRRRPPLLKPQMRLSRAFLLPHLENFSQRRRPPLLKPQMRLSRSQLVPTYNHYFLPRNKINFTLLKSTPKSLLLLPYVHPLFSLWKPKPILLLLETHVSHDKMWLFFRLSTPRGICAIRLYELNAPIQTTQRYAILDIRVLQRT